MKPTVSVDLLPSKTRDISGIGMVTKEELATLPFEKTLSYEEMQQYMKDRGYSHEQISNFKLNHKNDNIGLRNNYIGYTILRLDGWSYRGTVNGGRVNLSIIPELLVGLEYYGNSSSPDRIISVEEPTFDSSGGDDCTFDGQFDYRLVAGNEIYTALRGDVYIGGDLKWELGASVGIGERTSISLKLSGTNRTKVMYVSHPETYYSAGLNP